MVSNTGLFGVYVLIGVCTETMRIQRCMLGCVRVLGCIFLLVERGSVGHLKGKP